jgi:hypothetical protein
MKVVKYDRGPAVSHIFRLTLCDKCDGSRLIRAIPDLVLNVEAACHNSVFFWGWFLWSCIGYFLPHLCSLLLKTILT